MPTGCTAFLLNDHPRAFLTAGHCCLIFDFVNDPPLVEFQVDDSDCDGTPNPPQNANDVYPIDEASVEFQSGFPIGDPGYDWCYFGVFNNAAGDSPLQRQGALFPGEDVSYRLASVVPAADATDLRVTGYGLDRTPTGCLADLNADSQTEQTDAGPYEELEGTIVKFSIDIMGGNSGSALEHECRGLVYGIVTHAACSSEQVNKGTVITHPYLQDALIPNYIDGGTREPQGVCADCNDNGINDLCDTDCGAPGCSMPCGASGDCNVNGIPDECEPGIDDCNDNQVQDICDIHFGTSLDLNGNLIPDECESDVGACCQADDSCLGMRDTCCAEVGGTFLGDGISCAPTGACCTGATSCAVTTQACCDNAGGSFSVTESCDMGACCMGSGLCEMRPEACCYNVFLGSGVSCPQEAFRGRCCLQPTGCCVNSDQGWCQVQGGLFHRSNFCGLLGPCEAQWAAGHRRCRRRHGSARLCCGVGHQDGFAPTTSKEVRNARPSDGVPGSS